MICCKGKNISKWENKTSENYITILSDTSVECEGDKITLHLAESETFEKVHLLEKGRGMFLLAPILTYLYFNICNLNLCKLPRNSERSVNLKFCTGVAYYETAPGDILRWAVLYGNFFGFFGGI